MCIVWYRWRRTFDPDKPSDTVGCVALDRYGGIACGTSTGGITAKLKGRIGDTPIIGGGGYCDDEIGKVTTTTYWESVSFFCDGISDGRWRVNHWPWRGDNQSLPRL